MTPNDIFAQMPESSCSIILGEMFENEKQLYRNLIENLAKQRKLRAVFVERKPRRPLAASRTSTSPRISSRSGS